MDEPYPSILMITEWWRRECKRHKTFIKGKMGDMRYAYWYNAMEGRHEYWYMHALYMHMHICIYVSQIHNIHIWYIFYYTMYGVKIKILMHIDARFVELMINIIIDSKEMQCWRCAHKPRTTKHKARHARTTKHRWMMRARIGIVRNK